MSYFKKLLRNNLIVCLGYTLIFAIITYAFTLRIVRTEFNSTSQAMLSQTAGYVDSCIAKSMDTLTMIRKSNYVMSYANEHAPDYYNRTFVQSFLHSSIALPSREAIVAVQHEEDPSLICSNSSMNSSYFAKSVGITDQEFKNLKALAYAGSDSSIQYVVSSDYHNSILTMINCTKEGFSNPLYTIISIPLADLLTVSDMQFVMMADNTLLYASASTPDELVQALLNHEKIRRQNVFTKESRAAGFLGTLHYYYIIPQKFYHAQLTGRFILLFVTLIGCLTLGLFVMYSLTRKSYAPIENLLNAIDNRRPSKDQNEFDYIKNKLTSLTQSNTELTAMLTEYKTPLEKTILKDMLYGILPEESMHAQLRKYGTYLAERTYVTALVEYTDYEELSHQSESLIVLKETVDTTFSEHFSGYAFFRILDLDARRHALIAAISSYERFKRDLHRFLLQFGNDTGINLFASVGTAVEGLAHIDESFSAALNLSENHVYGMQYSMLCTPEDLKNLQGNSLYYPFDVEASIIEAVVNGNTQVLSNAVYSLVATNFFHKPFSEEQFSQFIFMFTSTLNRIFSALSKKASDFFPEDMILYLELKSCTKPQELLDKMNALLSEITKTVRSQQAGMDQRNKETMTTYIDEHYTSDISLLELAEHMNFSIEHTSRLFKQLVGQNFKDYLMHYRFQKAREMLDQNPNLKIKDVALAVGCNSSAALSRSFMKYAGMSAGDYLKQKH